MSDPVESITNASQVSIGGVQLEINPEQIMFVGMRRGTTFKTIDGGAVFQDRGAGPGDAMIQINGQLFKKIATLQALYALYKGEPGASFVFVDLEGTSYNVVFSLGQESFRFAPIRGSLHGYEYSINLTVTD